MNGTAAPTRRERQRQETLAEIKTRAMDQVAEGGAGSVSLNAIARAMGMSPAALYRYFASRDALLAELVVDAYGSLADALQRAADDAPGTGAGAGAGRLAAVAHAYRDWALDHPNSYLLIFQTSSGSGLDLDPDRTVAAAQRSMDVFLSALDGSAAGDAGLDLAGAGVGPELASQIRAWGKRGQTPDLPAGWLYLGLLTWTRLHGLISLELGHHLAATGVDPALLYETEVQSLLQRARLS
jgi:AcrR family transcriptional regulator